MTADMVRFRLTVPKASVCYMSWTIDAYDGVAFLKNESEDGVVSVFCSPDYAEETERIIRAFEAEGIAIEHLDSRQNLGAPPSVDPTDLRANPARGLTPFI